MKILHVSAGDGYDIRIERDSLRNTGGLVRAVSQAGQAALITDTNVGGYYAAEVAASLQGAGFTVSRFIFPAGEAQKNLDTIAAMLSFLADSGLTRGDLIVALGGGVTGDMAGFAAAVYLRGISFVQIPTSLLAQIDSSVGGKTGVDLKQGKNLCGAFWQPRLVLIDPDVLKTLSPRYFSDGMAEAVKYGCIRSKALFERLEQESAQSFLEELIFACVAIKREIVERDERERGERMLLNFGHTLGHALEKQYDFKGLSHGEAVGIGMVLAAQAGERNGLTKPGTANRIAALLHRYQLPARDSAPLGALLEAAKTDKKRGASELRFILLREIGAAFVHAVPLPDAPAFLGVGQEETAHG